MNDQPVKSLLSERTERGGSIPKPSNIDFITRSSSGQPTTGRSPQGTVLIGDEEPGKRTAKFVLLTETFLTDSQIICHWET